MNFIKAMKAVYAGRWVRRKGKSNHHHLEITYDKKADGKNRILDWDKTMSGHWSFPQDTSEDEFKKDVLSNDWEIIEKDG